LQTVVAHCVHPPLAGTLPHRLADTVIESIQAAREALSPRAASLLERPDRRTVMKKTVLTVSSRKPRNPLVAAAKFRHAGRHGQTGHGARQQAHRALRRELDRLRYPSP
jgi:hypothetical protein